MTDTVIRVENLGKKYIIDHQQQERYSTLRDAIANRARAFAQKPLKYFAQNDAQSGREEFWALKDVSSEIKQGDRVGIIDRNRSSYILKEFFKIKNRIIGDSSQRSRSMDSLKDKILDKLQDLPEPTLREVLSFIDFIAWRSTIDESPLLSVAGILSGSPVSAKEIEEELYGTREGE